MEINNWISVKDKLPYHEQTVYVYSHKGQAVCMFLDSIKINERLWEKGHGNEEVDTKKNPYYFCSQETKHHTLNGVTHWMPLFEAPESESDE